MAEETQAIDPDGDPYWAGAAEGELHYRKCAACDAAIFYPRSICPKCGATDPAWAVSKGEGVVYACTTVHRAPPAFADNAPYTVLLVDIDEGFRMMGGLANNGEGVADIAIGDRVAVTFQDGPDGRPAPYFTPA
ncbi:MAG: Zn-ribbon domain-containing OB-fold protein [Proteobacteria bacterium]|nr:Zn-ribbon domain-containing OB-fold protein [Pseudomonadota bacterium]